MTAPGVPRSPPTLGSLAARGAVVTMGGQGARIAVQLVGLVLLSRLLTPRDYGLVAMVLVVIGVGEIFRDFGLTTAAVQAKSLSDQQRDNLFWANTALGAALTVLCVAAAPLVAAAFDEPELRGLTQALAASFLLNGLAAQYRADLNRRLRFGRLALVDVGAQLLGLAAGVALALRGAGYWSLVGQQLGQGVAVLLFAVLAARWRPRRPRRDPDMRDLFAFGWNIVGTQVLGYASKNVDSLILGARFGPGPLGTYNRAFQLLMVPLGQVRAPTTTVALPVLARLQDEPARFAAFLVRGQLALGYTLVAALALAAGAADPLIEVVLGPRWQSVRPVLQVLAVAGACQTLAYVGYWTYLSRGLTAALLRYTLVSSVLRIACILLGSSFGVLGVAAGVAAGAALEWPLSLWWLSRVTDFPRAELTAGALRISAMALVAALASSAASSLAEPLPASLRLVGGLAAGVVVYLLGALVLARVRADLRDVLRAGGRVLRRRAR